MTSGAMPEPIPQRVATESVSLTRRVDKLAALCAQGVVTICVGEGVLGAVSNTRRNRCHGLFRAKTAILRWAAIDDNKR